MVLKLVVVMFIIVCFMNSSYSVGVSVSMKKLIVRLKLEIRIIGC